jgi:hypothetical protein
VVLLTGVSEVHSKLTDDIGEELTAARVQAFRAAVAATELGLN